MSKKKIAILLPFKDHFTNSKAGSTSIWVKDFNKKSKYLRVPEQRIPNRQIYCSRYLLTSQAASGHRFVSSNSTSFFGFPNNQTDFQ